MRRPVPWCALLSVALVAAPTLAIRAQEPAANPGRAKARSAFEDARFGLAVHLGVHALLGKGDRVMDRDRLPVGEYEKLPARYNPTAFDARSWARAARGAGARYLAVTAKHFDGFCLFDSKLTGFDLVDATPYGKDLLKQAADACRAEGLPLFVTYSLLDWHHPDYVPLGKTGRFAGRDASGQWSNYVAYYQGQIREICTNYGPIAGVRLEGIWDRPEADWDLEGTARLIRELQPNALIALAHEGPSRPAIDVQVFERALPGVGGVPADASLAWEAVESVNQSWGYNARDRKFKDAATIVRLLAKSAGHGANLLLQVAPPPDGALPKETAGVLAEVGRWLERNGTSIRGTRPGPIPPQPWGVSTRTPGEKTGSVFLHWLNPPVPITLPESLAESEARRPGAPKPLELRRQPGGLVLTIPEPDTDPLDTVIVLTPRTPPADPAPIR